MVGGLLGFIAASLLFVVDASGTSVFTPPTFGGVSRVYIAANVIALVGLIVFSRWALRRGMPQLLRTFLNVFTWLAAISLGLLTACFALLSPGQ